LVTLRQGGLIGRYRVDSLLAIGGFAKIYRGLDRKLRRRVAIKVPATRYRRRACIDEFRHEANENRKLRHPNVLPVLDFFVEGDLPVLVTPLGRTSLAELLEAPLPRARLLRYAHEMLQALAHAHRRHLMHLDVKPENLIVLWSGRLALGDFGTARRGRRTVVGDRTGTTGYMPPEQAAGHPSPRSDVYAAGIVVREMMHGRNDEPPRRGLPEGLLGLVERATQLDPRRRYPDAIAMLAELRRLERRA
jgi:serine/threonine protein kinase